MVQHCAIVTSPNGCWRFTEGLLRSPAATFGPVELDFFKRWTFARFLSDEIIALGFETGQPWSEHGSYGGPLGGIQVLSLSGRDPCAWELVSLECEYRDHDEDFIPHSIAWHERGVTAWLVGDFLRVQVLASPRPRDRYIWPSPQNDSDWGLELDYECAGGWRDLRLDAEGNMLTAVGPGGSDHFDLRRRCRSGDGDTWQALEMCD